MNTDPRTVLDALDLKLAEAARAGDWAEAERIGAEADKIAAGIAAGLTCHAAALWYASVGLPVFPLMPGAKRPYPGSRGCLDATTDANQINTWWAAAPASNVAIATGHLLDVIDIDGPDGVVSWANITDGPPVLGKVSTPRPGGAHLDVAATGSGNRAKMLPGIDYRGAGGYVVAPPSHLDAAPDHAYAGTYTWSRPLRWEVTP